MGDSEIYQLQSSRPMRRDQNGQRQGTAAEWAAANPVLDRNELGLETDTGTVKVGDGVTRWTSLAPAGSGTYALKGEIGGPAALEGAPLFLYGHSYLASDAYNTGSGAGGRWASRVASRARMGTMTTRAVNGRRSDQMARDIAVGASAWAVNGRGVIFAQCTVNDVDGYGNAAAAIRGYTGAWRAALALLRSKAKYAANTANLVYSSGWTTSSSGNPIGGTRFETTTAGNYFEFNVTGGAVDVLLAARSSGAGLVTFTVGGSTVGTLDLTATVQNDYTLACAKLTGLGGGTVKVRGTLTSGTYLGVEAISIPSETPPLVVVAGEGPILSYHGSNVNTYNGYLANTWLPVLASECAGFSNVVYVPAGSGWDTATMLRTDDVVAVGDALIHANDKGASYLATTVLAALASTAWGNGFNALGTLPTYSTPSPPSIPSGGQDGSGGSGSPTIADNFNRADSPSTLGSTSTGSIAWSATDGTWGISSNKAYCVANGASGEGYATVDCGSGDGTLQVTITASANVGEVCAAFRLTDANNLWLLYGGSVVGAGNKWTLAKKVAGSFTFLTRTVDVTPTTGDVIQIVLSGSNITAKVNGTTVATASDAFNSTATKHGLRNNITNGTTGRYDDWSYIP